MKLLTSCRTPPKKQAGQGIGPRAVNGVLMDVRTAAAYLGTSEKTVRGMVERKLLPYKRLSARIIFIKAELEAWLIHLPGCTVAEAQKKHGGEEWVSNDR